MQAILKVGERPQPERRKVFAIAAVIGLVFFAALVVAAVHDPIPVIGILGVAALGLALIRYPVLALGAVLFLLPFHSAILIAISDRIGDPGEAFRHWEDAAVVCLFLRALLQRVHEDRRLPLSSTIDNLVLAYILAYVVLAVASPARATVTEALGVYVEGPLLFLAVRFLRPSRRQVWFCVSALLAGTTIMGGAAIFERLGPHEGFLRWYGLDKKQVAYSASAHPYRSASFLIDTLILAFYLAGTAAFAGAVASVRGRWRMVALVVFAASAGGLVCTVTRSGYLGGASGLIVVLLQVVRNPRSRLAMIGITIIVLVSLSLHYVSTGTLTRGEGDTAHKNALARDVNLVIAKPFGYGLGTTDRFRFRTRAPGQLGATESTYMARAIEGGIEALAIYLITLYVLVLSLVRRRRVALAAGDDAAGSLASGAIGTIIAVALAGLFLGVLERPVEVVLWGVPALALAFPIAAARANALGGDLRRSTTPGFDPGASLVPSR